MRTLFLAACLLLMTGSAYADYSISYTDQLSTTPASDLSTLVGTLSVYQFDPAMGMLKSVSLTFTNQFNYSVSGQNNDGAGRSFTYILGGTAGPVETVVKNTPGTTMLDDVFAGYSHTWSPLNSGDTFSSGQLQSILTQNSLTAANLSSFVGTGNVSFSVYSVAPTLASFTGGNMSYSTSTFTDPTVTVTYDYTTTPIPCTVWLLGSGLLGLAAYRNRFKKA
jgi:hypothetical protein